MPTAAEVYDFEGQLDEAVAGIMRVAAIDNVLTRKNGYNFQNVRPRLEIKTTVGPEGETYNREKAGIRNISWHATLVMMVVTDCGTDKDGSAHRTYRALVRSATASLRVNLADVTVLPFIAVARLVKQDDLSAFVPTENVETTKMSWQVFFNIRNTVWPLT